MNKATLHPDCLIEDILRFRERMGDINEDPIELDNLYSSLVKAFVLCESNPPVNVDKDKMDMMRSAMDALMAEWPRRLFLWLLYIRTKDNQTASNS